MAESGLAHKPRKNAQDLRSCGLAPSRVQISPPAYQNHDVKTGEYMINAIVWDVGGVLITDSHTEAFWAGISGAKELRNLFGSGKTSTEDFVRKGAVLMGISEKEFLDKYTKAYDGERMEKSIDLYKRVACDNYILSDTNALRERIIESKNRDIFGMAKRVFLSHEIGMRKSSAETYMFVMQQTGANPEDILVIDNRRGNIEIARSLGMAAILFQNPEQLSSDLRRINVDIHAEI